jgi:uncharacterized protein YgiM (DUF1202 family)
MQKTNLFETMNPGMEEEPKEIQSELTDVTEQQIIARNAEVTEPEDERTVIGVVTNCLNLNIRRKPKADASVICKITSLTEIMIDEKESTDEFYKVCTAAGIDGFCMKKYIAVNP